MHIDIEKQVDELQVYFDNPNVSSIADIDKLSSFEFHKIKALVKKLKEDDIYSVSHRVSLQLIFGEVIIINRKEDARRIE